MSKLGELFVKIGADVKGALKGFGEVEGATRSFADVANGAGKKAFLALGAGAVAAGAGVALSAKGFLPYEQALANVQSIMPKGTRVQDEYDASIKRLSVDLAAAGGTAEVTAGLYSVLSAETLSTADSLAVLEISMKGAKAGLADTESAVNLLTGVSKAYTGTVAPAMVSQISDLTFEAVKLGQTTFPELASSMGQLAPIAASAGVSLEEMFGLMATLTGVTGNTSEVTTQLRGAITSLLKPNADMVKIMAPLVTQLAEQGRLSPESAGGFLQLSDALLEARAAGDELLATDIEGQMAGMMETMGPAILQSLGLVGTFDALATNAEEMNVGLAGALGRVEAYNAVIALTGSQSETAREKIAAMSGAAGATEAAFATMTDTASARLQRWKNDLEVDMLSIGASAVTSAGVIAAAFGEAFGPHQVDLAGAVVGAIDAITPALAAVAGVAGTVAGWMADNPRLAEIVVVALGAIVTALAGTYVALQTVTFATAAWGAMLTLIGSPVFLVIAALAALGAAAYLLWRNWDDVTNFFREKTRAIVAFVTARFEFLGSMFGTFANLMLGIFRPALGVLLAVWTATWETIKAVFATTFLTLKAIFTGDTELLARTWSAFGQKLASIWTTAWTAIKSGLLAALTGVKKLFVDGLGGLLITVGKAMWDIVKKVGSVAVEVPLALLKGIGEIGVTVWNFFKDKMSAFTGKLTKWATGVLGMSPTLTQIGRSVVESILNGIGSMVHSIGGSVVNVAHAIRDSITPAAHELYAMGRTTVSRIADGMNAAKGYVRNAASNIAGTIRGFFPASPPKEGPLREAVDWPWIASGIGDVGRAAQRSLDKNLQLTPPALSVDDSALAQVDWSRIAEGMQDARLAAQGTLDDATSVGAPASPLGGARLDTKDAEAFATAMERASSAARRGLSEHGEFAPRVAPVDDGALGEVDWGRLLGGFSAVGVEAQRELDGLHLSPPRVELDDRALADVEWSRLAKGMAELSRAAQQSLDENLRLSPPRLPRGHDGAAERDDAAAGRGMFDAGSMIVSRIADGMTAARGYVSQAASEIAGTIRGFFPSSPPEQGPLREEVDWGWLAHGMADLATAARQTLNHSLQLRPPPLPVEQGPRGHGGDGPGGSDLTLVFEDGSIRVNGQMDERSVRDMFGRIAVEVMDAEAGRRRRQAGVW